MINTIKIVLAFLLAMVVCFLLVATPVYIAASLQYENDYKIKTLVETQQQQDRIEQKIDLLLEK